GGYGGRRLRPGSPRAGCGRADRLGVTSWRGRAAHLDLLSQRRSVRAFSAQPIPRAVLERLVQAAVTAPSPTNRQPWRFAVVTQTALRQRITEAVRTRAEEMKAIIRQGHHAEDFGKYGDFLHEPLATAAAIVVPQYRVYPDLIANLVAS